VSIFGARANLNLDKNSICLGETIKFNLKDTSTVYAWTWDFADGDTLKAYAPSITPTVSHSYTYFPPPNGDATVSLIYYS
jgi:PKD repeat protein